MKRPQICYLLLTPILDAGTNNRCKEAHVIPEEDIDKVETSDE